MTGTLVLKNGEWVIKYDIGHEVFYYSLDSKSKEWSIRDGVQKFIHEGIEVDFSLVITGQFSEEKEQITKEFSAKILHINHETI